MIQWNVIAFGPILILGLLPYFYFEIERMPLGYSFLGGMLLAFFAVRHWLRDNILATALTGAWLGLSIALPMRLFPKYDVAPALQLLTFWLWVMAGTSTVFLLFRRRFEAYLNRNTQKT